MASADPAPVRAFLRLLLAAAGVAAAVVSAASYAADGPLPGSIAKVVNAYKVPHETISLVVQQVGAETPVVSLNASTPRNPASTIKLVTTFVALDVLGPVYTWPTRFYASGSIKNGILEGDLVLKGYGDPYLVTEDFWAMLGELRATGVHTITGDLVVDESHFAVPPTDPGAFDGQPHRLYNVVPSSSLVNFKATEFQFFQAGDGRSVQVRALPELPNLKISNELTVRPGKCQGYQFGISMSVPDPVRADRVVFSGAFPSACRSHTLYRSVLEPHTYAYGTFLRLWPHWGGTIGGGVRTGIAPARQRPLVTHRSRPLAEIIRPLNKWSNNVMTQMLLYSLAEKKFKPPYTREQGIEVLTEYLRASGLDTTSLVIENGSGLSRRARISADLMNGLLRHAWGSRYMPEFIASLSISGLDGTTRRRFRGSAETGRMHLKTGRIDNVAGIAGYVLAADGRMYTVALLMNHTNIHQGAGIEIQNAVLKWVYAR